MRVVAAAAAMLVAMLALGLPVQAEAEGRFYITPDDQNGDPDACDESTNYAASLEEPPAGQAPAAASGVGVACAFFASYTTVEDHQLSGDFNIEFWVGCTAGAMIELDYRLTIAGQDVVNVRPSVVATCGAGQALVKGGGVHATKDLFIPAGSDVVMRLALFAGPEPGEGPARNVYVTTGGENPSGFSAPGWGVPVAAAGGAQTLHADLETASVQHAFTNATSDTHVLNFTTDLINSTASFTWSASSGSVNATLVDANGTTVFEGMFDANGTSAHDLVGAPGDWNLSLQYNDFNGSFAFELAPQAVPVPEAPVDANATEELGSLEDKESPLPMVLPALVLLAIVCWRRRT